MGRPSPRAASCSKANVSIREEQSHVMMISLNNVSLFRDSLPRISSINCHPQAFPQTYAVCDNHGRVTSQISNPYL